MHVLIQALYIKREHLWNPSQTEKQVTFEWRFEVLRTNNGHQSGRGYAFGSCGKPICVKGEDCPQVEGSSIQIFGRKFGQQEWFAPQIQPSLQEGSSFCSQWEAHNRVSCDCWVHWWDMEEQPHLAFWSLPKSLGLFLVQIHWWQGNSSYFSSFLALCLFVPKTVPFMTSKCEIFE